MSNKSSWYAEGLAFSCTACGACCTGAGHVRMSIKDMKEIASFLQISLDDFVQHYTERKEGSWVLKENPSNGECIFLREYQCSIYQARPTQCRTFPWWPQVLKSKSSWQDMARTCEGITIEPSNRYSWTEIQSNLKIEIADRKNR